MNHLAPSSQSHLHTWSERHVMVPNRTSAQQSSTFNRDFLIKQIIAHEGRKNHVYKDTERHLMTIGVGLNLERPPVQKELASMGIDYRDLTGGTRDLKEPEIDRLLNWSLEGAVKDSRYQIPNLDSLPINAQYVIIELMFNIGAESFAEFVNFKAAIKAGNFEAAANELLHSRWASQVKAHRSMEMASMMRSAGQKIPTAPVHPSPTKNPPAPPAPKAKHAPTAPKPAPSKPAAPTPANRTDHPIPGRSELAGSPARPAAEKPPKEKPPKEKATKDTKQEREIGHHGPLP